MKTIHPLAREPLGPGWVMRVERNLADPFIVGEIVKDASSKFRILGVEGTSHPQQVNLVVERVP